MANKIGTYLSDLGRIVEDGGNIAEAHTYFAGELEAWGHNARINRGGSYSSLTGSGNGQAHHMPQAALLPCYEIQHGAGPALGMTAENHAQTESYKGRGRKTKKRDLGVSPRKALANGIKDVRRKFGRKYNCGMLEMLEYSKKLGAFRK